MTPNTSTPRLKSEGATTEPEPTTETAETAELPGAPPAAEPGAHPASARGFWAAVVVTLAVLVLLVVFILENGQEVRVSYFGATSHAPLGVALLLAAIIGGLVVVLAVAARLLQLRRKGRARANGKA